VTGCDADVVVVGTGPAGAATAILLAEQGFRVVALDRARFPRPKLCGEYVSPEAVRVLDRLGVLKTLEAAEAVPLHGMRITAPDGTVLTASYRAIDAWRPYCGHALAVPRVVLDATLVDRMRALPIDLREEMRVVDLVMEGDRVAGVRALDAGTHEHVLRAPLVIAADGRASMVAERLGCRTSHRLRRMALGTYVTGLADVGHHGEIFVDPPDYAILNPVGRDRVNLSLVVPLAHARPWSARLDDFLDARVKQLRHLARRVAGATRERVRALGPLAYRVSRPRVGGVLLVGDAAGFYDPFTGEGIYAALRGAELAAQTPGRALRGRDCSVDALRPYADARTVAFRDKTWVTRALQQMIRRRWTADLAARFLARRPVFLDTLLGVIGDYVPPRALLGAATRSM
jgi:geranylgeranyl reductase family protein